MTSINETNMIHTCDTRTMSMIKDIVNFTLNFMIGVLIGIIFLGILTIAIKTDTRIVYYTTANPLASETCLAIHNEYFNIHSIAGCENNVLGKVYIHYDVKLSTNSFHVVSNDVTIIQLSK